MYRESMEADLKSLQIDRGKKRSGGSSGESSKWPSRWIIGGILILVALGIARFAYIRMNAPIEVSAIRVQATGAAGASQGVVLNATGYIIAHHKIEVPAKVVGRVQWIGVEQGDVVHEGQVIVRLEDDEYRAQVQQAKGDRKSTRLNSSHVA